MATIDQLMDQQGGRGVSKDSGVSTVKDLFNAAHADITDLRTKFGTLLAKLDLDAGVTDVNYASTQALAAQSLLRGT